MKTSKLFTYLNRTPLEQWPEIKGYLRSKYSDKNEIITLFNYIRRSKTKLKSKILGLEVLHQKVAPHLPRKSFQNLMSKLSKDIEAFWIIKDLKGNKDEWEQKRILALNNRGFFKDANKRAQKYIHRMSKDEYLSIWKDYYVHQLCHEIVFSNNPMRESKVGGFEMFNKSINSIDNFYSNSLLYQGAEVHNRIRLYKEVWSKEILEKLNIASLYSESTLSHVLIDQMNLLETEYESNVDLIEKVLFSKEFDLAPRLALTLYYRLRRYYIVHIRKNQAPLNKKLLALIRWSIDSRLVFFNRILDLVRFISDIKLLIDLNQVVDAIEYKNEYLKHLNKDDQADAGPLSSIIIAYGALNYDEVVNLYVRTSFIDFKCKLDAASYYLRSSYELNGPDKDYFEAILKNLGSFLNRNESRLPATLYSSEKKFYHIFKLLVNGHSKQKIHEAISGARWLTHRSWLMEKLKADHD